MRRFGLPEIGAVRWFCASLGCVFAFFGCGVLAADTNTAAGWVQYQFEQAAAKFHADTNNADAAWQFGRACFDMADMQKDSSREAQFAEQGIAVSREAVGLAPNSAAAHYYLGMNIGELAGTRRSLSALRMVKDMER